VNLFGLLVAVVWGVSSAPLFLETLTDGELVIRGSSRAAWVLLPWMALAGLPRTSTQRLASGRSLLFALPILGLAAGLDFAEGESPARLAWFLGGASLLCLGWAALADRARGTGAMRSRYGWVWLLGVPLPLAYLTAFAWAPAHAASAAGSWPSCWSLNPLIWVHRHASLASPPGGALALRELLPPFLGLFLAGAIVLGFSRRERGHPPC